MRPSLTFASIAVLASFATAQLQTLTTTFANNNGGAAEWTNQFDLTVTNPAGVTIPWLDINTSTTTAGTLDIYVQPNGTYVGNQVNPAAWPASPTVSSLSFTGAGTGLPTNAILSAPLFLAQGSYAVAIHYRGVAPLYTNGSGTNQSYSDANIALALGSATAGLFSGTLFDPRVCNLRLYYGVGNVRNFAGAAPFGTGCGSSSIGDGSFYELFDGTTSTFDLSNRGFTMNWTGSSYALIPAPARSSRRPASAG
ncbi:MAG: hypothetical protein IPM29_24110 [Planctomycetes bacterium]|nr:hypothetical protein [Planctomycetota bacterium]